jgi:hypothetical protein
MANTNPSPTFPAFPGDAAAVTTSDTVRFSPSVIYTGSGGTIRVRTAEGSDVTFQSLQPGAILPLRVIQVFASTTTATNIVRIF